MFEVIIVVFLTGYLFIALEHPLKLNKAATALLLGVLIWVLYVFGAEQLLSKNQAFLDFIGLHPDASYLDFIKESQLLIHLGEISEILFFLLGAMTIVELIDTHQGFRIITDRIQTKSKVKLLWIICTVTFFLSAVLDNLTTSIVMVALLRKLMIQDKNRWIMASMIIIAANAGGAWSPIGDVTTIMLWIGGQITTFPVISHLFLPSLISIVIPLIVLSCLWKGKIESPNHDSQTSTLNHPPIPTWLRYSIFSLGIGALLFVPVFKSITHLPPYLGILFGLSILWITTEIIHRNRKKEKHHKEHDELLIASVIRRVDVPSVLFFLGILLAVSGLQSAGHLALLAHFLDNITQGSVYLMNTIIGLVSAVVDNVPLVAGSMGMYELAEINSIGYAANFIPDGSFWLLLAYCAGVGGSILIIGSAAGVAVMGLEKIDFIWYLKNISLLALIGYFAGIGVFILQQILFY